MVEHHPATLQSLREEVDQMRRTLRTFVWCFALALVATALGAWQSLDADLSNLGMVMEFDGRPVQIGSSAAILGHPVRSLVAASRLSTEAGERLEAGWIIMAGGATAAESLLPGIHVRNQVQELGFVGFSVSQ